MFELMERTKLGERQKTEGESGERNGEKREKRRGRDETGTRNRGREIDGDGEQRRVK